MVFDNSLGKHELIAKKIRDNDILINDLNKFQSLKKYYDKK